MQLNFQSFYNNHTIKANYSNSHLNMLSDSLVSTCTKKWQSGGRAEVNKENGIKKSARRTMTMIRGSARICYANSARSGMNCKCGDS